MPDTTCEPAGSRFRILAAAILLAVPLVCVGCSKERVKTDDPAKVEEQRQEHLDMTRRELEET